MIELNNVSKKFGKNNILVNANLIVNLGDSIALTGHSGSGKSTVLKILCGLTAIQKGNIYYSGKLKFNYVPENFPKLSITPIQYITSIGSI